MSKIEQQVINTIISRAIAGKEKYGKTMARDDLTFIEWLDHMQQELLDGAIYIEKIKEQYSKDMLAKGHP